MFVLSLRRELDLFLIHNTVILVISGVFSSVLVITIVEHFFSKQIPNDDPVRADWLEVVAAVVITLGFGYFSLFYRASALEMKRLDSMLRSILYAHLSESLTGAQYIHSHFFLLIR